MPRIFINYRREDSGMGVGRLAESLRKRLPDVEVFQDVSSIDPGADFVDALRRALADCVAVLVVIGPEWLTINDHRGRRKLDNPDDWVRQEIVAALEHEGVRVFPLLVEGAEMPVPEDLPDPLKPLARRQAHELTVKHWAKDVDSLADLIGRIPAIADLRGNTFARAGGTPIDSVVPNMLDREANNCQEGAAAAEHTELTQEDSEQSNQLRSHGGPPGTPQFGVGELRALGSSGNSAEDEGAGFRFRTMAAATAVLAIVGIISHFLLGEDEPPPAPPPSAVSETDVSTPGARRPAPAAAGSLTPRTLTDGEVFRDCDHCPEMVVIPKGSLSIGSPALEVGRVAAEGPQHEVVIARFALGRFEVTVGEFRRFVESTGYRTEAERNPEVGLGVLDTVTNVWIWASGKNWRDPAYAQDDRHPVVGVSWNDAAAYVEWLAQFTGKSYRLPSEAEWEHAARAGAVSSRPWGDPSDAACVFANVADHRAKRQFVAWASVHDCDDGYVNTAPVGEFAPNGFNLHDMIGNVWEWVQDCWSDSYEGAPTDGSAVASGDCAQGVIRGGSWASVPDYARSAFRVNTLTVSRQNSLGFRVARTL